jgi:hypothetical protein
MSAHKRNRYQPEKTPHTARKSYEQMHREVQKEPAPVKAYPVRVPLTGRARYTVERFLSDCSPATAKLLRAAWANGDQLAARRVPADGLPCVLILASYARVYGVELVDDFDALLERYKELESEFYHPDKFFGSCICLLAAHGQWPDEVSFESIGIPHIYEELLG